MGETLTKEKAYKTKKPKNKNVGKPVKPMKYSLL